MEYVFSIIIPVYNTERYLRQCLDSVFSQSVKDIQVICINDGSTDNSLAVLEEYQGKNSQMIIVSQENQGLSGARNTGIKEAAGEYILFLDSDDMLQDNALEEIVHIVKNHDVEILLYDADCMYETERLKEIDCKDDYYHRKKSYGGPKTGQIMFTEQMENDDLCDSACLMAINRQWLLSKSLFFRSGMLYEDCLFVFQCFMLAEKVMHTNKTLMIYRVREGSIMTSKPSYQNVRSRMICYSEFLCYLIDQDLSPRVAKEIERFAEAVMYSLKEEDYQLEWSERQKTVHFSVTQKLLAASMGIGIYKAPDISSHMLRLGFRERIKEAEGVVIYGAGKIGMIVYRYLKRNHLDDKLLAFAVTDGAGNREIEGIPVVNISDNNFSKDVLLLISTWWGLQWDMLQTAYQNGFHNVEVIHKSLERGLEECK